MFKILLPVDFSEGTLKTCQYAISLAATIDQARIMILHSFHDYLADGDTIVPPPSSMLASEAIAEKVIHRNEMEEQEQLETLYADLVAFAQKYDDKVQLERAFVRGSAEDTIHAEIKHYQPDLVMMSTEGKSSFARSFFGTVTTEVVQRAKVPVLTVPQAYNGSTLSKIAYATDFDKTDVNAITQLQQLLQPFSPHVVCVHISDEDAQQQDRAKLQQLQQQLQKSALSPNLTYVLLEDNDVAEALETFVQKENFDLIALTTHKRSFLEKLVNPSFSKKLVLESKVPVLVFHGTD